MTPRVLRTFGLRLVLPLLRMHRYRGRTSNLDRFRWAQLR